MREIIPAGEGKHGEATSCGRRSERIQEPRLLYFNRPFLIYARKRQPGAQPFFAMWVDNAELLRLYQQTATRP